jgi:hypothetical protein
MNELRISLAVLGLCTGAFAQAPGAKEPLSRLSTSAEGELSHSIEELNQLRAQIAAEKLPLAQELTQLEERLSTCAPSTTASRASWTRATSGSARSRPR